MARFKDQKMSAGKSYVVTVLVNGSKVGSYPVTAANPAKAKKMAQELSGESGQGVKMQVRLA